MTQVIAGIIVSILGLHGANAQTSETLTFNDLVSGPSTVAPTLALSIQSGKVVATLNAPSGDTVSSIYEDLTTQVQVSTQSGTYLLGNGVSIATPEGTFTQGEGVELGNSFSSLTFNVPGTYSNLAGFFTANTQGNELYAVINVPGQSSQAMWVLSAVPEPSAYALVLAGLGLIGFASRHREC